MKNVALIAHPSLQQDKLFDIANGRDGSLERFYLLREYLQSHGITCRTADMFKPGEIDFLIFNDIGQELAAVLKIVKANPYVRLLYVGNEPVHISPLNDEAIIPRLPVDVALTWNDRIAGKYPHVIKCNIGQPVIKQEHIPEVEFNKKQLICCIFSNKSSESENSLYGERLEAIDFFSAQPSGFDLYGMGWESSKRQSIQASFKGWCESKKAVMQSYKFSIAYENMAGVPGYITEKIFDCFAAGTVPIYYGPPNVADYIPRDCYIDRGAFRDYAHLYDFLTNMPEAEYQKYLDAVKVFIGTTQYREFTSLQYVQTVTGQIDRLTTRNTTGSSLMQIKWQLLKVLVKNPYVFRRLRYMRHFVFDFVATW